MEGTRIDEGIRHLSGLTQLRTLTIHNTKVTENCLQHMEGMIGLETFYLGAPVTDKGVASLKKMASLQVLYIAEPTSPEWMEAQLPGVLVD